MNEQIFETVLNEILEDLKQVTRSHHTLQETLRDFGARLDTFATQLDELQVIVPPVDQQPLQRIVKEGLDNIRQLLDPAIQQTFRSGIQQPLEAGIQKITAIVEAQPKAVVQQHRFILFPETDRAGHYKFLIRWIVYLILGLAALGVLSTWIQSLH